MLDTQKIAVLVRILCSRIGLARYAIALVTTLGLGKFQNFSDFDHSLCQRVTGPNACRRSYGARQAIYEADVFHGSIDSE